VAGFLTPCLLCLGFPRTGVPAAHAQTNMRVQQAAEPEARPADDHFLRDSIPATMAALDPPDTTDDDFLLPEEKSKKKIVKEILIWTIAAAFVAFFIVKVFIDHDDDPAKDGGNGKDVPPPQ
jgi:hypothetical protein